jgi:cytochrome c553
MRTRPALLAVLLLAGAAGFADSAISQSVKPDSAKGQALAGQICAACHNPDGNSAIAANPILAGQLPEYLAKQLANFKAGADGKAERNNPIMTPQVAALSADDIRNVASYYAQQKLKPQSARQKDLVDVGQRIFRGGIADKGVPACAGCHGATGAGVPSQYPRLQGQFAQYTELQMKAWRAGERVNDGPAKTMRTIAAKMSDREIAAVSDYIAGLR